MTALDRIRVVVTTVVTTAALCSACDAAEDPEAEPSTSDPATSSVTAEGPVPTDPTTEPTPGPTTAPPDPTVAPTTGAKIGVTGLSIRGPQGWVPRQAVSTEVASVVDLDDVSSVTISSTLAEGTEPPPLDDIADIALEGSGEVDSRLDDVVVDGQPAFHLTGSSGGGRDDAVGLIAGGRYLVITFDFTTARGAEQVIEAVLASAVLG